MSAGKRTPGPEPLPYWTRCFPGGRTVEIATKHQEWTHEACNRIMTHDALTAERDALRKALELIAGKGWSSLCVASAAEEMHDIAVFALALADGAE